MSSELGYLLDSHPFQLLLFELVLGLFVKLLTLGQVALGKLAR
jgi:hypothetical protein